MKITSQQCKWRMCGKQFVTAKECYLHVKSAHIPTGTRICEWDDCTKVVSLRSNLVSHLNKHISINTDYCHHCDRDFKWRGDFTRHNKRHTENEQTFNEMANILFR